MAADIYAAPPHTGRGGWTWYTGSAAWCYTIAIETILGFDKQGERFTLHPSIPPGWDAYRLEYQWEDTTYEIAVHNPYHRNGGACRIWLDGGECADGFVHNVADGGIHKVTVEIQAQP